MPELKYGMREWRDDAIKLTFGDYLVHTKLPNVPRMFGHVRGSPRGGWDILGNATYGDCVLAGAAHETMVWAMATKRKLPTFDTAIVVKQYMELAGGQDTGLDPIAIAKWRCTTGLTDADGTVHKTRAFAAVELDEIAIAAYLFGVCGLGLMLPDSADDDFGKGYVWNDLKSEPKNGHYIPVVGRNSMGNFIVVTWGRLQAATPAYIKRYFAGAVCYYSLEYLFDSGLSPEAIDTAQLDADLATLAG